MRPNRLFLPSLICFAAMGGMLLSAGPAQAHRTITMYEYFGQHPVQSDLGTWCEQDALHVHNYALDTDDYLIYEIDGVFHFVGDAFIHQSLSHHWYYDPHPISHISSHWCVLEGPHAHWWRPRQHQHHHTTWVSYDGYWVWDGEYTSSFWWTWNTWYAPFWSIHSRRVHNHHRYHPGHHYRESRRARPRYDGRHRHTHHSDHRMSGARDRHSHWYSSETGGGKKYKAQGERHTRESTEREHSGPNNLGDRARAASRGAPTKGSPKAGYRLPGASEDGEMQRKPAERSSYGAPAGSNTRSKSKSSAGSDTQVLDYRKTTTGKTTTSPSQKSSSSSKSRSSSKSVPSYGKATTSPSRKSSSSSKSRSSSKSSSSSSKSLPNYDRATTSPSRKPSSSSKSRSSSKSSSSSSQSLPNYDRATTSPSRKSSSSSKSRTRTRALTKPAESDDERSKSKKTRSSKTSDSRKSKKAKKNTEKR